MKFKNYLQVNEVLGYKLKAKDKKLILAFIDGAKDGEGKALYIDDPGNGTTELKGGMAGVLATRDDKGYITIGRAYGNVSQTWINAIRKMTPKAWLKEDKYLGEETVWYIEAQGSTSNRPYKKLKFKDKKKAQKKADEISKKYGMASPVIYVVKPMK
jgi:hypothetical protein